MTIEQFEALEDFIQAKIENELARSHGRNAISEAIREMDCREQLKTVLGVYGVVDANS